MDDRLYQHLERFRQRLDNPLVLDELDPVELQIVAVMESECAILWPEYECSLSKRFRLRIEARIPYELECCKSAADAAAGDEFPSVAHLTDPVFQDAHSAHHDVCRQFNRCVDRATVRAFMYQSGTDVSSGPLDVRPVVALDIDGVLNARSAQEGFVHREVTVKAGVVCSPFFAGHGERDVTVSTSVDRKVVDWVVSLSETVSVVWATSWEDAANTVFAPAVGLPQFPVAVSSSEHPPSWGQVSRGELAFWKGDILAALYPRRPLVWIDDMAASHRDNVWRHPDDDEHTLVVVPDPATGITPADMAAVDEFLARYANRQTR